MCERVCFGKAGLGVGLDCAGLGPSELPSTVDQQRAELDNALYVYVKTTLLSCLGRSQNPKTELRFHTGVCLVA